MDQQIKKRLQAWGYLPSVNRADVGGSLDFSFQQIHPVKDYHQIGEWDKVMLTTPSIFPSEKDYNELSQEWVVPQEKQRLEGDLGYEMSGSTPGPLLDSVSLEAQPGYTSKKRDLSEGSVTINLKPSPAQSPDMNLEEEYKNELEDVMSEKDLKNIYFFIEDKEEEFESGWVPLEVLKDEFDDLEKDELEGKLRKIRKSGLTEKTFAKIEGEDDLVFYRTKEVIPEFKNIVEQYR